MSFRATRLSMPFLTAILTAISPGYGHAGYQLVQADGVPNLAAAPNLLTNWQLVPIGEGVHTITLVDSDYGSSPDATNKLIFVYTDALQPDSYDYWFFSLNGQGDSQTVNFRTGGRAWFGFLGYGPASAVHGGTTIRIDSGPTVYVEGQQHMATIANLLTNWVHVTDLSPGNAFRLFSSDFGSSPDAANEMVFIYNDQLAPSSYDHFITTLNGVGDEVEINYLPQGGNCWLGFVAWGPESLHGGSVIEIDPPHSAGIDVTAASQSPAANYRVGYATPNPVLGTTQFEVDGPAGTGLDWAVYDVSGRCVDSGPLALVGGPQAWNWSRRAGHQRVPGGIYWITFGKGARAETRQMMLLP